MKKLLLLFLLIPTLLTAQTKAEKELEKRVKGMTMKKAEAILKQAKTNPPVLGGWHLVYRDKEGMQFEATGNSYNTFKLSAAVFFMRNNKIAVGFWLLDPAQKFKYRIEEDQLLVKLVSANFIAKNMSLYFLYRKPFGVLLNKGYEARNGETVLIRYGIPLATKQTIIINSGQDVGEWNIHNQEALYAAAFVLKPNISYKDFLIAVKDNL